MTSGIYSLEQISTEQNFALATLCKQKDCLQQWLKYLNVKSIHMPEEVAKYKKRIADINNAIKILENEFEAQPSSDSENNLRKSKKMKTMPDTKNDTKISSSTKSFTSAKVAALAS